MALNGQRVKEAKKGLNSVKTCLTIKERFDKSAEDYFVNEIIKICNKKENRN